MEPLFTVQDLISTILMVFNMLPFYLKVIIFIPLLLEILELAINTYWDYKEKQYLKSIGIKDVDDLSGLEFEKFLEFLFKDLGYKVTRTQYAGDYGADLIIEKDGLRTVVQAKRYKGSVGVKAIQEIVAAKNYYDADSCMVVTNSRFTDQAFRLAKKNHVRLIGRKRLRELINQARKKTIDRAPQITETSTLSERASQKNHAETSTNVVKKTNYSHYSKNTSSICADCGKPVSEKVKNYCIDHKKEFLGNIYCFDCQQKIRKTSREIQQKLSNSNNHGDNNNHSLDSHENLKQAQEFYYKQSGQ